MKPNKLALAMVVAGMVHPSFAAYSGHVAAPAKPSCGMVSTSSVGNTYNSGVDSQVCWSNRVKLSGHVDVVYSDSNAAGSYEGGKSFDLAQGVLAVDAKLNKAWSAKVVLREGFDKTHINYSSLEGNFQSGGWSVPEMNLTYKDMSHSPLFFKAGRGFVPFGSYANPFALSPTLIQANSQLNEDYLQLGVMSAAGWHASASAWTNANDDWKYTMDFGFKHSMRGVALNFDASYITDINEVAANSNYTNAALAGVVAKDSAWQVGANTNLRGVDLGVRYLKANASSSVNIWGAHMGYSMHAAGFKHSFGVDWESANTAATPLDSRMGVEYKVGLARNVDAGVSYTKFTTANATKEPRLWLVSLTGKF